MLFMYRKKKSIGCLFLAMCLLTIFTACSSTNENASKISKTSIDKQSVAMKRDEDRNHFVIKNGILIKYTGNFDSEKEIILPKEVSTIGKKAFSLGKEDKKKAVGLLKTAHISIPAHVTLEKGSFEHMGPMEVVFEEGREEIDEEAFFDSVITGIESKVVLPSTVKILKKRCFCNVLGGSFLTVELNDEIEIIEDAALLGAYAQTIPKSVKKIGKNALGDWGRLPQQLPEGVEVLESHFIDLESGKIHIPSSVKKIGRNAVWWSEDAEERGYCVAKDNAYYKSDKKGWLYTKEGKKVWSSSKCY